MAHWGSTDSSSFRSGSSETSRNYVDPWDLENYVYLRRHSIAVASVAGLTGYYPAPQPIYSNKTGRAGSRQYESRSSHRPHSDYSDQWLCGPSAAREPGYDGPASVEEIYFRPTRPVSSRCYYHQPIYKDESSATSYCPTDYAAPIVLYSPLPDLGQAEALEELRMAETIRRRNNITRMSNNYTRDDCQYHRRPSEMLYATLASAAPRRPRRRHRRLHAEEEDESAVDEVEAVRYREPIRPTHITLNNYGHLKIDYTNSWNSLHRKMVSN